jgi:preprotein translocase subunit SecA
MANPFKNFFQQRSISGFTKRVADVNALEERYRALSDTDLTAASLELRTRIQDRIKEDEEAAAVGAVLDDALPEAFALAREAARRTLGQRPYDVQLVGGQVLHSGAIAEMGTGEGKTLAAVAPAYLNALAGRGTHVVTVNEYLARRDAVWMGQVYRLLGLSVSCLVPNAAFLYDPEFKVSPDAETLIDKERDITGSFRVQSEFLKPASRREAYLADITYGTNHEFGFDYLRDNLAYNFEQQVQRPHFFAIIDEVDSILIDEARTPLIISAPDMQSSELYQTFAHLSDRLIPEEDYTVDEKFRAVNVTPVGIEKVERALGIANIYAPENVRLVHFLEESLKAKALYHRDKNYVVKDGEIIIVDEFTGRLLAGRRYNGGLHQAIEAKEHVHVQDESRTYAKISIQNYFRLYAKISGMTGTAQTSAEEFHKVYDLNVHTVPTNKPVIRDDMPDLIYKTAEAKYEAIAKDIKARHEKGQPVLLGTTSIEKNELISAYLSRAGVPYEILNAKNNEREGAIIAQAGHRKSVTVATNMAGRGVDIILGGNPPAPEEAAEVRALGGLHVIGTERHEARRIDNQLRGRAGRQGDPGSSQFFLSLDDDLMRIFGGDRLRGIMERFNFPEDEPIQMGMVSKAVAEAQAKVEGANFDMRKHLLEYDDVLNKQRAAVYKKRQEVLTSFNTETLATIVYEATREHADVLLAAAPSVDDVSEEEAEGAPQGNELQKLFTEARVVNEANPWPGTSDPEAFNTLLVKRSTEAALDPQTLIRLLGILDMLWMNHLDDLESLSDAVRLRAYGQRDPLSEYRTDATTFYRSFWQNFNEWVFMNVFKMAQPPGASVMRSGMQPSLDIELRTNAPAAASAPPGEKNIGRNDPCPCGSGKKWKKCGLLNTEEHRRNMQK